MKTILVTGSRGFIGKNLCSRLKLEPDYELLEFNSNDTSEDLEDYLSCADFIFHLAGINRPRDESDFDSGNRELTEKIISFLDEKEKRTPVLMTSSIQAEFDNPYGNSKKAAEEAMFNFSQKNKSIVFVYRLPNVFGKWCRPNYNSVVATFCHNISHGLPITASNPSNEVTLVYIDDVVSDFISALMGDVKPQLDGYCYVSRSFRVTLQQLIDKIKSFKKSRDNLIIPNFEDDFNRFLYATYTSYLEGDNFSYPLNTNFDERGWLAEFVKANQFGQIFVSKTKPGITRGNHWHHTKVEKFLVLDGEADICFRKIGDLSDEIRYTVSGDKLTVLDIPIGYTHSIKNIGENDLMTIFWANEIFDKDKPDTYYEEV